MKAHPTEFFPEGASAEDADEMDRAETQKLSDAEKYAAQTRKNRQNQDYSALQGALDHILSGFGAIFSGLATVVESISDLLNLGPEGRKVVVLGILVLALLASNIYTYVAYKPTSESALLRRHQRSRGGEGDLNEAVRLMLRDVGEGEYSHARGQVADSRQELEDLVRVLDQVEKRTSALKGALKSSIGGQGGEADLD
jgi:hypothetical protein